MKSIRFGDCADRAFGNHLLKMFQELSIFENFRLGASKLLKREEARDAVVPRNSLSIIDHTMPYDLSGIAKLNDELKRDALTCSCSSANT